MFKQIPHNSRAFVPNIFDIVRREKYTKGDVIKRIMKEQKQVFGALLETKKEKARRLKLEKGGQFSTENVDSKLNSELSWMMNISNTRIKHLKVTGNDETSESKNLLTKKNSMVTMNRVPKKNSKRLKVAPQESNFKVITIKPKNAMNDFPSPLESGNFMPDIANESRPRDDVPPTFKSQEDLLCTTNTSPEMTSNKGTMRLESPNHFLERKIEIPLFFQQNEKSQDSWQNSEILHIPASGDKDILKFPSVTRILNATMSESVKKRLEMWTARMIEALGQEGFDNYKRDLLENGKLLHATIDNTLRKLSVDVPENLRPCYNSVQTVLKDINHVRVIESHVVHPHLRYRGVIDCVASYKGNMCLIDWKKSDRVKSLLSSTYDAPLQIASYIGALNADKNYPFQINSGLIVVAYTTGNPPSVYQLDETKLQTYWKQWLGRLNEYYAMQNT